MTTGVVLAANNGDVGGGEVMLLSLADSLTSLGVTVQVVGPAHPSGVVDVAETHGYPVVRLAPDRKTYMAQLRAWDRTDRQGVLWCNGLVPAVATAGRRGRVVHLHLAPTGAQRAAARLACVGALGTLVPSQSLASTMPWARVMWNWSTDFEIHRVALSPHRVRLGFLGRLTPDKGLPVLAEAVRLLSHGERCPPVELVLAGEPRFASPEDRELIQAALSPISEQVTYAGWMDRGEFFGQIDAAVFPSVVRETFGLVVAEAMSARIPFVISDAGALPEVAGPEYPWVAAAGDSSALAGVIQQLVDTPGSGREVTAAAAYERWKQHFSPAAGRSRLRAVLEDLEIPTTD